VPDFPDEDDLTFWDIFRRVKAGIVLNARFWCKTGGWHLTILSPTRGDGFSS